LALLNIGTWAENRSSVTCVGSHGIRVAFTGIENLVERRGKKASQTLGQHSHKSKTLTDTKLREMYAGLFRLFVWG